MFKLRYNFFRWRR